MWHSELDISTEWLRIVLCAAGGIAFHICRKQMLRFFFGELALRFRAVIVSVSTSEKPHASTYLFFCFYVARTVVLGDLKFEESFKKSFSAMGDIEAPNSNRPRQTTLLSVLPSKEFASSRKGMLLIAEVVRNEQRNLNQTKLLLYHCCAWCAKRKSALRALETFICSFLTVMAAIVTCGFYPYLEIALTDCLTVIFEYGSVSSRHKVSITKGRGSTFLQQLQYEVKFWNLE